MPTRFHLWSTVPLEEMQRRPLVDIEMVMMKLLEGILPDERDLVVNVDL